MKKPLTTLLLLKFVVYAHVLTQTTLIEAKDLANQEAPAGVTYSEVALENKNIHVQGARFSFIDELGMNFHRFDASILESNNTRAKVNPMRAKTTSGVMLTFYTKSPSVRLEFVYRKGDENRNSTFGFYQNGALVTSESVRKKQGKAVFTQKKASDKDELIRHDVVLPNWANPILAKLELESGYSLEAGPSEKKPSIAFLGDSISHGTGQSASYQTFPFIASQKLNANLYNLAVGGGKISSPVAQMLQHFEPLDAIWVLVGYNNWQGASQSLETITLEYETMLDHIRTHQPQAAIFCSTLTYTRHSKDAESGVTAKEVREAIAKVVNERIGKGDSKIHLVRAETFTNESYLRFESDGKTPSKDTVHLSVAGAAMYADDVVRIVSPLIQD